MKAGLALVAVVAAIVLAAFSGSSAAVGDPAFCPPGEVETLIAEQIAVLGQLNPAPSAGVGTGKNAQANAGRFGSLQARLQDALAALAAGNTAGALEAIASVVAKADGALSPPDWLTGATATAVADALGCITGAIGAGGSNANVYVSVSPDFAVGPHRIVEETIGAGGSLSLLGSLTTSGDSNLNQSPSREWRCLPTGVWSSSPTTRRRRSRRSVALPTARLCRQASSRLHSPRTRSSCTPRFR